MIQHAPYATAGIVFIYGKTKKTACGKRVATSKLVTRTATNCPECKAAIARDCEQAQQIMDAARELGYSGPDAHNVPDWYVM